MPHQPSYQKAFALFTIALMGLTSCINDFPEEYPEFIGTWTNETTSLTIDHSGDGDYEYYASNGTITVSSDASGKVKIKDDVLSIGSGLLKKRFDIDAYPTEVQVDVNLFNTYIVLDGETLFLFPVNEPNPDFMCANGILDQGEDEVDCGGDCPMCGNCFDAEMNQDEEGIDCGGECEPCDEGPCADSYEEHSGQLDFCDIGNSPIPLEFTEYVMDTTDGTYMVDAIAIFEGVEHHFELYLPSKPTMSRTYVLNPFYVEYEGKATDEAELNLYRGIIENCIFDDGATLYITVVDGKVTATFCDINFTCGFDCRYGSAKLSWDL